MPATTRAFTILLRVASHLAVAFSGAHRTRRRRFSLPPTPLLPSVREGPTPRPPNVQRAPLLGGGLFDLRLLPLPHRHRPHRRARAQVLRCPMCRRISTCSGCILVSSPSASLTRLTCPPCLAFRVIDVWTRRHRRVVANGHTVVIGWSEKTLFLLGELAEMLQRGPQQGGLLLVLGECDEGEMQDEWAVQ